MKAATKNDREARPALGDSAAGATEVRAAGARVRVWRFLAVVIVCAAVPLTSPAQVEQSPELQAVLERQSQRAQRGERGLTAFQQELRPLAEGGEPAAQFLLGTMLVGAERDTALRYLTASAEAGCSGAAGILAVYSWSTGTEGGEEWLERAISGGDAASMYVRATRHWRGDNGFAKSTVEALAWAQLARARSYSSGLTPEIERLIGALGSAVTPPELAAAAARLTELDARYPKKPFYLCSQSVPSEG